MKRELSIKDELRAIQSGELTCSPEKLAASAGNGLICCAGHWKVSRFQRLTLSRCKPISIVFLIFLVGRRRKSRTRVFQPIVLSRRSLNRVVYAQAWL